jgi:hypothetical protein
MRLMRPAFLIPLFSAVILLLVSRLGPHAPPAPPSGDFCYVLSGDGHTLTWVSLNDRTPRSNEVSLGRGRTHKTDALALQPQSGVLFSVDTVMRRGLGYLGTLDTATGAFQPRAADLGRGRGALGEITFYDVSGLAFDSATGWLYAAHIVTGAGAPDVLFRVDPLSGRFVPGAFAGADYVPLYPLPDHPFLWDVDDIAIDPATSRMYGIINNSFEGDRLVVIDTTTGALSDVGAFGIREVEGLAFDARGRLWATAGGDADRPNHLYAVDPATGQASHPRVLDNSGNYEGLACPLSATD